MHLKHFSSVILNLIKSYTHPRNCPQQDVRLEVESRFDEVFFEILRKWFEKLEKQRWDYYLNIEFIIYPEKATKIWRYLQIFLDNNKSNFEISSNFSGLLRIYELYHRFLEKYLIVLWVLQRKSRLGHTVHHNDEIHWPFFVGSAFSFRSNQFYAKPSLRQYHQL